MLPTEEPDPTQRPSVPNAPPIIANPMPALPEVNPFDTPQVSQAYENSADLGDNASLGLGYWLSFAFSILVVIGLIVANWPMAMVAGWMFGFGALRIPLRNHRRRVQRLPPLRLMLDGFGDYWLSVLLMTAISMTMSIAFFTICTASVIGLSAIYEANTYGYNMDGFVISLIIAGFASVVGFITIFSYTLRI